MKRLAPIVLLLLLSALGLSACGGGGETDEEQIADVIERSATSTDPAICKETQTVAFMEQNSNGEGPEAVKDCEEEAKEGRDNPESVEVSDVEVEGGKATAVAAFVGGPLDGQSVDLALVEEGGTWKLDEIESFHHLDPEKLIEGLAKSLEESGKVDPRLAACLVEGLEESSESRIEEIMLSGNEGFEELAEECGE